VELALLSGLRGTEESIAGKQRPPLMAGVIDGWVGLIGVKEGGLWQVLVVFKPNRIICKHTDANCSSFHLKVFLGLSNPQGQRQTSTLYIARDSFGERRAKFNLGMSRTSQM
jgi:hypothetical protein